MGYPIQIIKNQGEWVYFEDWVNNRGWVHRSLISDIPTAVVKVKKANIRSGPGIDNKAVNEVVEGEIYRILGREGNWYHLGYYHGSDPLGWIRYDLIFGN